jgi:sRNA-binding protein
MSKTTMRLPDDIGGFGMRGIEFDITKTDDGNMVDVPEDLVAEAQEYGLVVIKSPEAVISDEEKAQQQALLDAEAEKAEAEKAEAERIAAEEKAEQDKLEAEQQAAEEAKIKVGDSVTFADGDNTLSGTVKELRVTKKNVEMADVEVAMPDSDPEVWEVPVSTLTKVTGA